MRTPVELRCIACPLAFCCANCRRAHERNVHRLHYECPICRHDKFLCSIENLQNEHLIKHLVDEHLPLHCNKCGKIFQNMTDFKSINKCQTIHEEPGESENEVTTNIINEEKEIEDRFNSLYDKISADLEVDCGENFEAIVSINKTNKTATITPLLNKNATPDISTSEEDEVNKHTKYCVPTPYPKASKPRIKRADTPHIKKVLMRQMAQDVEDDCNCDDDKEIKSEVKLEITKEPEISGVQALQESENSKTPSRILDSETADEEVHTPISHIIKADNLATLASAVTTSTPTHPASQWALFPEPGADSPLSEIEGMADTASPDQQSSLNESSKGTDYMDSNPSKSETKKLKSIIITGGRSRLEGQDSSEKQVTFADSGSTDSLINRTKKVKFADDTKFDDAKPLKRVFRRPKRMLTPGPQRMRRITNPHFQAILNRFENQQGALARTPVYKRDDQQQFSELTPALAELATNLPARAIHFKDESPTVEENPAVDSPANELFKSCMGSPDVQPNAMDVAISTFSSNIAGSIQTCLTSALQTSDDATEIQFKFVITKKRVSVRRIVDDGKIVDEKTGEFDRQSSDKTNIWRTITRAVKNVFWSRSDDKENFASTTPLTFSRAKSSLEMYTSASKRKCEEITDSDISPLNHKRYKYGRIRGRRPISRMLDRGGVSGLKMSHSAEQHNLINQVSQCKECDQLNQSF